MQTFEKVVQPLRDLYVKMHAEACLLERRNASLENSLAGALLQATSLREERNSLRSEVEDLREQLAVLTKRLEAAQPQPQPIAPRPTRD